MGDVDFYCFDALMLTRVYGILQGDRRPWGGNGLYFNIKRKSICCWDQAVGNEMRLDPATNGPWSGHGQRQKYPWQWGVALKCLKWTCLINTRGRTGNRGAIRTAIRKRQIQISIRAHLAQLASRSKQ
jgi:hypothetical protein